MLVTDFYQRPLSHLRRTTIRQMAFSEIAPSRRFLQIVVERSIELQISGHCLSSKSGVIEYGLASKRCSGLSLSPLQHKCSSDACVSPNLLPPHVQIKGVWPLRRGHPRSPRRPIIAGLRSRRSKNVINNLPYIEGKESLSCPAHMSSTYPPESKRNIIRKPQEICNIIPLLAARNNRVNTLHNYFQGL